MALEENCSHWKGACEKGNCIQYVFSCLDVSSNDKENFIDQDLLAKIALNDGSSEVRAAAAEKLTDQELLSKIAKKDSHEWVRRIATKKLTDQTKLAEIILEAEEAHIRSAALENITNQALLAKIVLESNDLGIREFAVKNLTSQALLAKIAVEDENITVRSIAANKLIDLTKADNIPSNNYPEKLGPTDFLSMIPNPTEGEVLAWESSGTESLKINIEAAPICGNDYCDHSESNSNCPVDCFPEDIKPVDLSEGDKAVFLDFVYKGQKSGLYFVVNRNIHEKLASLPRSLSHKSGEKIITKKRFYSFKT